MGETNRGGKERAGRRANPLRIALDAAFRFRPDGTILEWNDRAEALFGWSAAEAVGRSLALLLPPRANPRDHPLARLLLTGRGPLTSAPATLPLLHKNTNTLLIEISAGAGGRRDGERTLIAFARSVQPEGDLEQRQALVIEELNHRMRNLLGIVSGIARQSAVSAVSLEEFVPAFQGRLIALDHAYRILTTAAGDRGSLRALIDVLFAAQRDAPGVTITVEGPEMLLLRRQVISLNMILHELVTNAAKYGALSQSGGSVTLRWDVQLHGQDRGQDSGSSVLVLEWVEHGPRRIEPPAREGFGTRVIEASARQGLHGTASTEWLEYGLRFRLEFGIL